MGKNQAKDYNKKGGSGGNQIYCIKPIHELGYTANPVLVEARDEDSAMETIEQTHALARFDCWRFVHVSLSHVSTRNLFHKNPLE